MSGADNARIRKEHAALLQEKAKADASWHEEVRNTLKAHGDALVEIRQNVIQWPVCRNEIEAVSARVRALEDFKLKQVSYSSGALVVVLVVWKAVEYLSK